MTLSQDMSVAFADGKRLVFVPYEEYPAGHLRCPAGWRHYCAGCALASTAASPGCNLNVTRCRLGYGGSSRNGYWKEVVP